MKYPINPEYLANCPNYMVSLFEGLEDYIIKAICERLNASGQANATALELIRQLQRGGMPLADIERRIKRVLKLSDAELDRIFDDAVKRNNDYYNAAYDKMGLLQEEAEIEQFAADIDAIRRQTKEVMRNVTQSMGFGMRGLDGSVVVSDVQQTYQRILDKAAIKVMTGTESYNVAIRDGVREMTNSGLIGEWVEYRDEEGEVYHRNRVDVAVRRAVMTGVTQVSAKYTEQAAEDFDTPYREVSAHRGARDVDGPNGWENHKRWQGKVYSIRIGDKYPNIYTVCGLGDVTGLEGANCRHMHFPFIEGFSERTWTDEELANIDRAPFEYQGRKYNAYEATQKQRQIERALRNIKRRMLAYKANGDNEAYTAAAVRYRRLNDEYKAFSKAADLKLQSERGNIQEFGPKEAKEAQTAIEEIKIRESRASEIFNIGIPLKGDAIKAKSLYNELQKSDVGREVYEYLDKNNVHMEVLYTNEVPKNLYGRIIGSRIEIYAVNTKTIRKTAETIIHETTHHRLNTDKPTQWEESFCFSQEMKHTKPLLTISDLRSIIKEVKGLYPDLPWR